MAGHEAVGGKSMIGLFGRVVVFVGCCARSFGFSCYTG